MSKILNVLIFVFLFFFQFNTANAIVNCEEIQLDSIEPGIQKVTDSLYPSEQNLYKFTFDFSMQCGFRASQIRFPTQAVVDKLANTFYFKNINGQVKTEINGQNRELSFYTKNSLYNGDLVYEAKHMLSHEIKYIHMQNKMELSAPVVKAQGLFIGIKNISWNDSCDQESAGWCYAWKGGFEVIVAWDEIDFESFKMRIKKETAPAVFKETYNKYALFVADQATK